MLKFAANYCRFWVIDYYNISPLPHSTLSSKRKLYLLRLTLPSHQLLCISSKLDFNTRSVLFEPLSVPRRCDYSCFFWFLHVVNIWLVRLNIWYKHRQFVPRWHVGGQFSDCNSSTPFRGTKRGEDTSSRISFFDIFGALPWILLWVPLLLGMVGRLQIILTGRTTAR